MRTHHRDTAGQILRSKGQKCRNSNICDVGKFAKFNVASILKNELKFHNKR